MKANIHNNNISQPQESHNKHTHNQTSLLNQLPPQDPLHSSQDILSHNHYPLPEEPITYISLSHFQLHKLVHDPDHCINKVRTLNNQAVAAIHKLAFQDALILLTQAEKILQYAAGSGKNIEREIIICVLHNIACTYHKVGLLDKCTNYIEGLIFNMDNQLTSMQNSIMSGNNQHNGNGLQIQSQPTTTHSLNPGGYQYSTILTLQSLDMRTLLAAYQIRFCALNSQQYQHKEALGEAKKAVGHLKHILTFDERYIKNMLKKEHFFQTKEKSPLEKEGEDEIDMKYQLLMEIIDFQTNLNTNKYKDILKATHFSLQIWNKIKTINDHKNQYTDFLKSYSIGNLMELKPLENKSKKKINEPPNTSKNINSNMNLNMNLNNNLNSNNLNSSNLNGNNNMKNKSSNSKQMQRQFGQSVCYRVILLSICYFSISTQMRMLLQQSSKKNIPEATFHKQFNKSTNLNYHSQSNLEAESISQYREADIYHLLSIILISSFVTCDILYLKHVINSYTLHFNSDFIDYKTVESESLFKILQIFTQANSSQHLHNIHTQIQQQLIPHQQEYNQYRLKDKLLLAKDKKIFNKNHKKVARQNSIKKINVKNYSSLQNKSIIKEDKNNKYKNVKIDSKDKQKVKSKAKSKSKTIQKQRKSKEKDLHVIFLKSNSKSKKKQSKMYKDNLQTAKQSDSDIILRFPQRKSLLKGQGAMHSKRVMTKITENKSPKRNHNNIYELNTERN